MVVSTVRFGIYHDTGKVSASRLARPPKRRVETLLEKPVPVKTDAEGQPLRVRDAFTKLQVELLERVLFTYEGIQYKGIDVMEAVERTSAAQKRNPLRYLNPLMPFVTHLLPCYAYAESILEHLPHPKNYRSQLLVDLKDSLKALHNVDLLVHAQTVMDHYDKWAVNPAYKARVLMLMAKGMDTKA